MGQMSDGRRRLIFGFLALLAVVLVGASIAWWPDDGDRVHSPSATGSSDDAGSGVGDGAGPQRAHGDAAALPGDSEPTKEEAQEYAKLIAAQVESEVGEAEAESKEEVLVDEGSAAASAASSLPETTAAQKVEEEAAEEEEANEEEAPAPAISKHAESFQVPTLKTGFHTHDYSSSPPPRDKVFAGSVRWKQEAAIRLQRQSLALSRARSRRTWTS